MEPKFADRVEWELTRTLEPGPAPDLRRAGRPRDLETEEALSVAAALGRAGCRVAVLRGGVPRGRPDWPQIAQVLSRSGVEVHLRTDGRDFGLIEARLARAAGVSRVVLVTGSRTATRPPTDVDYDALATHLRDAGVGCDTLPSEDAGGQGGCRVCQTYADRDPAELEARAEPAWPCEAANRVLGIRSDGTVTPCLTSPDARGVGNVRQAPLPQLWRAAQTSWTRRPTPARTAEKRYSM